MYCKNAISVPSVRPVKPFMTITQPITATIAYSAWDRLLLTGPMMPPKVLAAVAASHMFSFSSLNFSSVFCSRQKTLTTFAPSIISSM